MKRSLLKSYKVFLSPCQFHTLLVRSADNKMDFQNGTTFTFFKQICECGKFQIEKSSISVGQIYLNLNICFLGSYSLEIWFLKEIILSSH